MNGIIVVVVKSFCHQSTHPQGVLEVVEVVAGGCWWLISESDLTVDQSKSPGDGCGQARTVCLSEAGNCPQVITTRAFLLRCQTFRIGVALA